MEPGVFNAVVEQVANLTGDVRAIGLRLLQPPRIEFVAGQFVSFSVAQPGRKFATTRAYTIASTPDEAARIELLLNRVPDGAGSEYLFGLEVGNELSFRGPYGTFTLRPGERDVLFVATGTGIAPFRAMLWWLAAHDPQRAVTLVWGLRSESDIYYQDEFARLRDRMPRLRCVTTLSNAGPGSAGAASSVQDWTTRNLTDVSNLDAYVCGNPTVIADVVGILKDKGPCAIYKEQFYGPGQTHGRELAGAP